MDLQKSAAAAFAAKWQGKGDEKQDSQRFWIELLQKVYGVEDPASFVRFETRVKLSHTSFIDVMIPATHTMIEQKGRGVDLEKPIRQSDGTLLKPAEQAKRYAAALPYSERPRWIITCNFRQFQVFDMEHPNDAPQLIELADLADEAYRLQFMVDVKDSHITKEMEISKSAGELVGRLYTSLQPLYLGAPQLSEAQATEYLNKLCVRLVFCLYAEDAGIFGRRNMFHDYLDDYRPQHFAKALSDLFQVLDQEPEARDPFLEAGLAAFPYVNGGLFAESVPVPPMNDAVRRLILEDACNFDWSQISPTIFGAIFESTLNPATRRAGGMHYTSIENIHKVIDPLFLDAYKEEFHAAMQEKTIKARTEKLQALQQKLAAIRCFDPACGSGNFLTESYLSLRRLENDILRETVLDKAGSGVLGFDEAAYSPIKVSIQQFYGIEINDFAVSVAKTAIWIAESQMMQETEGIVHREMNFLPLTTNANIHEGNALRMDWKEILPPGDDVKIMGNPPFVGARLMKAGSAQKQDMAAVFDGWKNYGNLDYVCAWYKLATDYMKGTRIHAAFVSTNSVSQGDSVAILWKPLFTAGIHIDFAHRTFIWDSESKQKAHVHCVIVGFSYDGTAKSRTIFTGGQSEHVTHINAYLIDAADVFVESRSKPLCQVPALGIGNQPIDDGNYLFTKEEMEAFLQKEPAAKPYFRKWYGAQEFLHRQPRYCLWLGDCSPRELKNMPHCLERVKNVQLFRSQSRRSSTKKLADSPTRFQTENMPTGNYIVIPKVSSERRRNIPMGFMSPTYFCSDLVFLIPDATLYHFGILESNVHMAWMRTVAGRLKSDYRYSKDIVYNDFPWPTPTPEQKDAIEKTAQAILDARELYPDSSLADLYDEVLMPKELREAHRANDRAVMRAYGFPIKMTEPDCVAALMQRYEQLTAGK